MLKPLVIYHANCADGYAAAFSCWLKLGDEATYMPEQYGNDPMDYVGITDMCKGREIYILDFSFPKPVMEHIFANAKRVVWLDHHKTAFEMWCPDWSYCDTSIFVEDSGPHHTHLRADKSGAMLAWEYFHPGTEVPLFIRHIDDRDRWVFALPGSREFNAAIWSHAPWSFVKWKDAFIGVSGPEFLYWPLDGFYEQGAAILRAHNQNVQAVVKGATRRCRILETSPKENGEHWEANIDLDVSGLAANCPPHLTSDVGHELANQSGTFGLLWCMDKDGVIRCSLRSNGDYDVSAIASALGGGGHKNAAGFSTDIQTLMGWLK